MKRSKQSAFFGVLLALTATPALAGGETGTHGGSPAHMRDRDARLARDRAYIEWFLSTQAKGFLSFYFGNRRTHPVQINDSEVSELYQAVMARDIESLIRGSRYDIQFEHPCWETLPSGEKTPVPAAIVAIRFNNIFAFIDPPWNFWP